jgi:flagellar motility protein MotE (MotC chaperone)
MGDHSKLTRFLAFAVLVCSAALAFCVSILGLTWTTGKLPFVSQPLLEAEQPDPKLSEKTLQDDARLAKQRYGEVYAFRLYEALHKERERLKREQEKLVEQKKVLAEYQKTVEKLDEDLREKEERVKALLHYTDDAERANVRRMSAILAESSADAGARMLLTMPPNTAARILDGMEPRRSGAIVDSLLAQEDSTAVEKAGGILAALRTLAPDQPPPADVEAAQ